MSLQKQTSAAYWTPLIALIRVCPAITFLRTRILVISSKVNIHCLPTRVPTLWDFANCFILAGVTPNSRATWDVV